MDLKRRRRNGFIACKVYIALPMAFGLIGREDYQQNLQILLFAVRVYFLVKAYRYRINK